MKNRLLLLLICLLPCLQLHAIWTDLDVIYYNGRRCDLYGMTIRQNQELRKQITDYIKKHLNIDVAGRDDVRGYWSVKEQRLVLDSVGYLSEGDNYATLGRRAFRKITRPYRRHGQVEASWISDEVWLGAEEGMRYEGNLFPLNRELEAVLYVKNGRIDSCKNYRNYVWPGLTFKDVVHPDSIERHFPLADIPELRDKQVWVEVKLFPYRYGRGFDSCQATVRLRKPDTLSVAARQRLKKEVEASFMAIYPWKEYLIHGEPMLDIPHFMFPINGRQLKRGPIFKQCDTIPEFPGGQQAMYDFIDSHVRWPYIAREWKGNWRVIVQFVVEKDGSLTCPQFLRRAGAPFEVEVLKMLRQFPRFKPAVKDGKPVRFWFILPVNFIR